MNICCLLSASVKFIPVVHSVFVKNRKPVSEMFIVIVLYCSKLFKDKGVEPLIDLLSDTRELAIANSAVVLTNMATDEGLRSEIQNRGVISALIEPLKSR